MLDLSEVWFFSFNFYSYLFERKISFAISLPKFPQQLGLGQTKARTWECNLYVCWDPGTWVMTCCFPWYTSAESLNWEQSRNSNPGHSDMECGSNVGINIPGKVVIPLGRTLIPEVSFEFPGNLFSPICRSQFCFLALSPRTLLMVPTTHPQ